MSNRNEKGADKWLWTDPLEADVKYGEILLADFIRKYIEDYGLLVQSAFNEDNLKGASYSLSARDNDGWIVDEKGELSPLKPAYDTQNHRYYIVPMNSYVFIGIKEHLRLPFYIIARHNLKITYAYQGLLLGTGPQVDPGYSGRLYIPLHNFTNSSVHIYIDESFVNIDFSRTTPVLLNNGEPRDIDDFYARYSHLKPIPREKLKRTSVEAYLSGHRPTSSLGTLVRQIEIQSNEFKTRKLIDYAVGIAAIGLVIGLFATFYAYVMPMEQRIDQLIKDNSSMGPRPAVHEDNVADLEDEQKRLNDKITNLEKEVDDLKASKTDKSTVVKH